MLGERVWREKLLGLIDAHRRRHDRPVDLVLHVAAQVPGQGLEPTHRVGGGPRLRLVVGILQAEDGVFEAQLIAAMLGEVGIHTRRIGIEDPARPR